MVLFPPHLQNRRVQGPWCWRRVNIATLTISPSSLWIFASQLTFRLDGFGGLGFQRKSLTSRKTIWIRKLRCSSGHLGYYEGRQRRELLYFLRWFISLAKSKLGCLNIFGAMELHLEARCPRAHHRILVTKSKCQHLDKYKTTEDSSSPGLKICITLLV